MHSYHDNHGRLPPAVVYGEDRTPLLSWRVLLLPFIEGDPLFKQFTFDEPWDSLHHLGLLAQMLRVYFPFDGSSPPRLHTTFYQVFVGPGTAFEETRELRFKDDFPDGTSNTVFIVEAGVAVSWSKPEDLVYGEGQPLPKLGAIFRDSFRAALGDGSVRPFRRTSAKTRFVHRSHATPAINLVTTGTSEVEQSTQRPCVKRLHTIGQVPSTAT
jgi:hypothetical protein